MDVYLILKKLDYTQTSSFDYNSRRWFLFKIYVAIHLTSSRMRGAGGYVEKIREGLER